MIEISYENNVIAYDLRKIKKGFKEVLKQMTAI